MEALDGFCVDRSKLPKCLFRNGPGVPYYKSSKTGHPSTDSFAPWDSVVMGKKEGGFVKVGKQYLPMTLNKVPVLAPASVFVTSDGVQVQGSNTLAFRVTGGRVEEGKESSSPISAFSWQKGNSGPALGLAFLRTRNIMDLDGNCIAPWDSFVFGTLTEGFLKVGHRYLPMHVDGECVLVQHGKPAMQDTSKKAKKSSAVQEETQIGTPNGVFPNFKERVATEEDVTTTESVSTKASTQESMITTESMLTTESVATQLVEKHAKDSAQLDDSNAKDDAVVTQLTNPNMQDIVLESRLASFESRLSKLDVERSLSANDKLEARLVEHAQRISSCEDQLSHLVNTKHVETPSVLKGSELQSLQEQLTPRLQKVFEAYLETELLRIKESVAMQLNTKHVETPPVQKFPELQSFKEQLMPRLQACEAELTNKVFGADLETELLRIKESVAMQLTQQREQILLNVSDIKSEMNELPRRFVDLESHLENLSRDVEARVTTHVQDMDTRLAAYRDQLNKFAVDASPSKTNPAGLTSSLNVLGTDSHMASDDHHSNFVTGKESYKAGGTQVQAINQGNPMNMDGVSQDVCWKAPLQDLSAMFWALEANTDAPFANETRSSISQVHSASPQISENPTGDLPFCMGSSAGLQGPVQPIRLNNPWRNSATQSALSHGAQSPSSGARHVQAAMPGNFSPQPLVEGGRLSLTRPVYVMPGTELS